MDVKAVMAGYKESFDKELDKFLNKKLEEAKKVHPVLFEVVSNIKEFSMCGGKRIRPVLFLYGFKCIKDGNEKEVLEASISIELLQSFLLIHDDIMDEDELRRGKPSFWKTYEDIHKERFHSRDPRRFGNNVALLAGDLCFVYASCAIASTKFDPKLKAEAIKALNNMTENTAFGQILDAFSEEQNDVCEEDIMLVHSLKTSRYTIEGPLHMGAILAGAKEKDLKTFSDYGIPLGQAFQLQDDMLGMFGDEEKLGKPIGSDLKEGKRTLLICEALKRGSEEQKEKILSALGNRNITEEQIEEVRKIVVDTGAFDYSKKKAQELATKAKKVISNSKFKKEGKEFLLSLADYLINRDY